MLKKLLLIGAIFTATNQNITAQTKPIDNALKISPPTFGKVNFSKNYLDLSTKSASFQFSPVKSWDKSLKPQFSQNTNYFPLLQKHVVHDNVPTYNLMKIQLLQPQHQFGTTPNLHLTNN